MYIKLTSYIEQQLLSGNSDIRILPEDDLLGSGLIDSMGMINLIAFIENNFNVVIPAEDMIIENFMTIKHIERYIIKRKSL
ncbi:MAG: acyl carrier protein [Saprospiraceae bacterium]